MDCSEKPGNDKERMLPLVSSFRVPLHLTALGCSPHVMMQLPSPTPHLEASIEGTIGWLLLNNPARRNALNAAMWAAIPGLVEALASKPQVRCIILRGAGAEAFAAGADISEFAATRNDAAAAAAYEALNGAALMALRQAAKPVIAMIHGFCIGGGLAIAMACDLRIADTTAVFSLPPARLGLAYPLESLHDLVSLVGPAVAKDLILTARRISSVEAHRLGLIERLATDLSGETAALAAEMANGAPLTQLHAKRAIDRVTRRPGHASAEEVAELAARCFNSADYAEGRAAFLAKRKPVFTGK